MIYLIASYIVIVIVYSLLKKNNSYDSFKKGVLTGLKTVINMFSALLVFVFAINCLINCGIIKYLSIKYQKSGFVLIIIQMFVRPLSNVSSFALLTSIYNEYGVDSFYGILSTFIHSTFDTLFYIITIYFSVTKITKYQKVLWYGIIILLFNYFLVFVISFFFKY